MAYVLINIGLIRFNQKNYQEAESSFFRALVIDEKLPEFLLADRIKIEQVVNNLLNNAIKFTERGQVKFEVKLLEESKDQALIEMKSNRFWNRNTRKRSGEYF